MADTEAVLSPGEIIAQVVKGLPPNDPLVQSVEVGEQKPHGESLPRRSPIFNERLLDVPFIQEKYADGSPFTEVTLYSTFRRAALRFKDSPCLGYRPIVDGEAGPYVWSTFGEVQERSATIGSALRKLGVQTDSCVGLYSKNTLEWVLTDLGCHSQSFATVALYDTFGEEAIEYIINHAELPVIVSAPSGLDRLINVGANCPTLHTMVVLGEITEEQAAKAKEKCPKIELMTFEQLEELGKANPFSPTPPKADSLAVIMYTSGTTGMPKGVIHRHSNLVCTLFSAMISLGGLFETDVHLSYLPLAHIFERMVSYGVSAMGGRIGFFQGDIRKLRDDINALKPTIFAGVPKVYDRFKSAIDDKISKVNFVVKFFVDWGFSSRQQELNEGRIPKAWSLIFDDFKKGFGGNLRLLVSGGAPLSSATRDYLRVCFGCPMIQGYGLTETSAAGTLMMQEDGFPSNHIGGPVPSVEIKLVDIPEMNYLSTNDPPQGEICIRGPSVSEGYYKDPEKTAADFEENGWYHTGDVGEFRSNGALAIIDRKKNIFKLAQGEYIAAENIELKLANSRWISQFWIYGDSLQDSVVAIVTLDLPFVEEYIKANGLQLDYAHASEEEINQVEALTSVVYSDILATAKSAKLHGFEIPKALWIAKEWLPESDLVTPTMKLKRPQLKAHYKGVIEQLYVKAAQAAQAPRSAPAAAPKKEEEKKE